MNKFSVLIPYRDRSEHLKKLVPQLRRIAELRQMDMEIIVAEQVDTAAFRHGGLKNEAARIATGNIFIIHDVDYVPNDDVIYWPDDLLDVFCPVRLANFVNKDGTPRPPEDTPAGYRHFKNGVDANFFGGSVVIKRELYEKINGYSPLYEGWGMDDEDFRERVLAGGIKITRGQGIYTVSHHGDSHRNDLMFRRSQHIYANRAKFRHIGLRNVQVKTTLNADKAKEYNVDKWVETTDWVIDMQPQIQPRIVSLNYGHFALMNNVANDHVQRAVANGQIWEPSVMALCQKYVVPGSTVLDIGANIGTFTVWLSQLVGPSGQVRAFEPQRIVYQQLLCNVFLNNCQNVYAERFAVGTGRKSTVTLTPIDYSNGAPGEVRIAGNNGEVVGCIGIDSLALQNVSLIKIDVERYEPFVFDGAKQTIEKHRPVILFELTTLPLPDYPPNFVVDMLQQLNYNIYVISAESGDYIAIPQEKDDNV